MSCQENYIQVGHELSNSFRVSSDVGWFINCLTRGKAVEH